VCEGIAEIGKYAVAYKPGDNAVVRGDDSRAGGQIGAGRLHGFGFAHEAVTQLRGTAGDRQIKGDPKVAVATSGGGPLATALLLARD